MAFYLFKRLLSSLPVLLGVFLICTTLIYWIPGDPTDTILGENASVEEKNQLRASLGLDQPVSIKIIQSFVQALHGDLGLSLYSKKPVVSEISTRMGATLVLASTAMLLSVLIGIPLGMLAAVSRGSLNLILNGYATLGLSLPGVFLGPFLIWLFAVYLGWLPVSGSQELLSLVLPAVSLAIPLSAVILRMTRASLLEVLKEDYIRVAKSKGLSNFRLYQKHALTNALIPIITIVGLQTGAVLTGTVVTETIFDWPGLGTLLLQSIQRRDYPMVQACILLVAVIYILVNLVTDLLYAWVQPKMRMGLK